MRFKSYHFVISFLVSHLALLLLLLLLLFLHIYHKYASGVHSASAVIQEPTLEGGHVQEIWLAITESLLELKLEVYYKS
jgi:hypothetical protein